MKKIKEKKTWIKYTVLFAFLTILLANINKVNVYAFDNAKSFVDKYDNRAIFQPEIMNDGIIYFGESGKLATSSATRFKTIGWKIRIVHNNGSHLQTMYAMLNGIYLSCVDRRTVNGYEYELYAMRLSSITRRLNESAKNALSTGNAHIYFDACNVLMINNVLKGGMTDDGPSWGNVYTTREEITNAANWSEMTKSLFYQYYDKSAEGLFYTVSVSAGTGIQSVSGGGTYCYGISAKISAVPKTGYVFSGWTGSGSGSDATKSFYVNENTSWVANGKKKDTTSNFYRNLSTTDDTSKTEKYTYDVSNQKLLNAYWKEAGRTLVGWKKNRNGSSADYSLSQDVSNSWILANYPSVNLYGHWKENAYRIEFVGNGDHVQGSQNTMNGSYNGIITLPNSNFTRSRYTFIGWSTTPLGEVVEYTLGSVIKVSELALREKLEYVDGATIKLYAVWDGAPNIEAYDLYFSYKDVTEGKLTESYISSYGQAWDKEDGAIAYRKKAEGQSYFEIVNFDSLNLNSLGKNASVEMIWKVRDRVGNETEKTVKLSVVDAELKSGRKAQGQIRFISSKYFEDSNGQLISETNGGLAPDSCWRLNPQCREVLKKCFD